MNFLKTVDEDNLVRNYCLIDAQGTRSSFERVEYCAHEIAHYVVLFRRAMPLTKEASCDMNEVVDVMSKGRSQLHELRVLALEHVAIGTPIPKMIYDVWSGLVDAGHGARKDLVPTRAAALRRVKKMRVSPRLIRAYKATLKHFSEAR